MWVEPDTNMPTGESLVRQVLYGQRYFEKTFGVRHSVCWLPDCFGFSGALPQILQNVRYANGRPLEDSRVVKAIDAGRERLGVGGRIVIRPSGTEPVIRVMAEGDDERLVSTVVGDIVEAVKAAAASAA